MQRAVPVSIISISLLIFFLLQISSTAEGRRRGILRSNDSTLGFLRINCAVKGATVIVDSEEVGLLPFKAPLQIRVGKHTLKIVKRGYTEYLDVFTIRRNKTTSLDIDLLPYAGIIMISSNVREARVFIDGKFAGVTPLELEALIGQRTIRVAKAGYYDFVATLQSIAGKTRQMRVTMAPLPIGSTPYRPKPLPPPNWYEKWYVWAGAAGCVAAITLAIVLPVSLSNSDKVTEFKPEYRWPTNR